jgi:hypothetical protein
MSPPDTRSAPALRAELDRLLTDGLARYRNGDIDGALMAWEVALQTAPGDPRALGYVDYVRAHYEYLSNQAPAPLAELLVPFGLASSDDPGDYEVQVTRAPWSGERLAEPAVEDGWILLGEETPVPRSIELEVDEPRPTGSVVAVFGDDDATTDYASMSLGDAGSSPSFRLPPRLDLDDDSGEVTRSAASNAARETLDLEFAPGFVVGASLDLELSPSTRSVPSRGLVRFDYRAPEPSGEHTTERALSGTEFDLSESLELGIESHTLPAESSAVDRRSLEPLSPALAIPEPLPPMPPLPRRSLAPAAGPAIAIEDLRIPPPTSRTAVVDDDDRREPAAPVPVASGLAAQLLAEADRGRMASDGVDDVARRRITWLIDRARTAAVSDGEIAVMAIDLALSEAPDSAVAQKLIHRHRDVLLDCYYRYFGSLDRRPAVVGDMRTLGRQTLEPRAAFLLSRIDGMLTYDELLDVSGMGRLEACRHLAHLTKRGLVRSG